MHIVADQNIASVRDAFEPFGAITTLPGRAITPDSIRDAEILLVRSVTRVDAALVRGSRVRFVGSATAGIDHIDVDSLAPLGITVAHAPGSNASAVADYVMAALLAESRRQHRPLEAMTLGVVGVGQVGSQVVGRAAALGMTVIQNDPPLASTTRDPRFEPIAPLRSRSDAITVHVPLTTAGACATRDMINTAWLDGLRPGCTLINTSRGAIADESALIHARRVGRLAGLVVDVWRGEPVVNPDLLAAADLATPHIAGYSAEARLRGTWMVYQAFCRWIGHMPGWAPALPPPTVPDAQSACTPGIASFVRTSFDIEALSRTFKSCCAAGRADRAERFDRLRTECAARREFSAYPVPPNASPADAARLSALGFRKRGAA